ncbi:MAG TPA: DMT family transporter [Gammaproteobacteria bacterium]|jgi:drug/metabolite transporter (DMT)-like permease|nr:DMT family transporter [Gammaproteobacteria bacterium]
MNTAASHSKPDQAALASLAVLTLIWGYNWVVMKLALQYAGPFVFAASRTALGGACLLLLLLAARKPFWPRLPGRVLLLGLFQTTLFIGLVCWALQSGNAGKSAVLAYTMPFWVILLAPFTLGERLRGVQWAAVGLAFGGLLLIFSPWQHSPDLFSSVLALLAGMAWGISVIIAKKTPVQGTWDLLSLTGWQMLMGAVPLAVIAWLLPSPPVHWNFTYAWTLFYNVVPANALAWALWLFVVGRLSATLSGLASLASPVVGVLTGWLQLGERPAPAVMGGMLLVFAALGALTIGARRRR